MPIIRSASDIHCGALNTYNYDRFTLEEKHAFIRGIGEQARTEHAAILLFPGDTLDERARHRHLTRDAAVVAKIVGEFDGHAIAQRGNHDAPEHFRRKRMRNLLGKPDVVDDATLALPGGVLSAHGHGWNTNPTREGSLELVHYLLLLEASASSSDLQAKVERVHTELVEALAEIHDSFQIIGRVREYRDAARQSLLALWRSRSDGDTVSQSVVGNPTVAMKNVRKIARTHDLASPFCAAHFAAIHGCPVAVVGHTHRAGIDIVQAWSPQQQAMVEVLVANNGSPIQRGCDLHSIKVDTDAGTVELQTFAPEESTFVTRERRTFVTSSASTKRSGESS